MSKNCAPLFFLIIASSIIVTVGFYMKKDVETYATNRNEPQTHSPDSTADLADLEGTESNIVKDEEIVPKIEEHIETKQLDFQRISEDYFDNALFIGDSRTVGLKKYAMLGNASFYSETGMTIYNIFDKKIQEDTLSQEKLSLEEVLINQSYEKIYLMVGINELGRGTAETYYEEYKKVLLRIQGLQPNSIIFIEGNMNVTKEKSDNDPIFNNINIRERNKKVASLEDKKTIFYIDVNEVITDVEGYLIKEYTFDNIHLKAKYYSIWKEFLLDHGILKE